MEIAIVISALWLLICLLYAVKELVQRDYKELRKSLYLMIYTPLAVVFLLFAVGMVGYAVVSGMSATN